VFGVGPGVSFGRALLDATGVPQGLVPCAHGATSMQQWDPALKEKGGASLYGAMMRRFHRIGGKVAGMFWYQGESDAGADSCAAYTDRMVRFVTAVRQDTGSARLPVVIVQLARVFGEFFAAGWNSVQEQQRRLPELVSNLATVPAIDLPLNDNIHISAAGHRRLGRRAAQAMLVLREGRRFGKPPIEVGRISLVPNRALARVDIAVSFRNVTGRLRSDGPATGFALSRGGTLFDRIFRVDLSGTTAYCRTICSLEELRVSCLHYGFGLSPVCTITDEADRSLPVFGPIALSDAPSRAP